MDAPSKISQRILERSIPEPNTGCWLWMGSHQPQGYGTIWNGKRPEQAHRVSYREFVGEIPDDCDIDHVCRQRACVNPDHLEAVSHQENMRRSDALMGINARKTHCKRGHELSGANLRINPNGSRQCRQCVNFHGREARRRKRETSCQHTILKLTPSQLNGSETSLQPDTSRQATLTSDQSSMSGQTTCGATRNVISSPGLADGAMPCASQDGLTTDLFGRGRVRANRGAKRAGAEPIKTNVTFGRIGFGSLKSYGLTASLANKYRTLSSSAGSMKYPLIWKGATTPWGRPYFRLVLSKRDKSARGFGLWPAPTSSRRSGLQSHGWNAILGPLTKEWLGWLMGYQNSHSRAAPTVTPSSPKRQRNSSSRRKKQSET